MKPIRYGVVLIRWVDDYNFVIECRKKFKTKKEALKYIEDNKQKIFEEEKPCLENIIALELGIEKMAKRKQFR